MAVADSMISNQRLRRILLRSSASSVLIGHYKRCYITPVPVVDNIQYNRSTCGSRFTKHHSGAVIYDARQGIPTPTETTRAQ